MLDWLTQGFAAITGWLAEHLPQSPFANLTFDAGGFSDVLGWLNWIVPFKPILALMAVWLAAILAWRVVRFLIKNVIGKAIGGKSE